MTVAALKRNSIWNLLEVLGSTVVLFIMLRLILKSLGVEALGVWSLVLASVAFARLADLGVTGGLGRYIAILVATDAESCEVRTYIDTALILNICLYGVLSLALYWPAWWGLGLTLTGAHLAEARVLLPYAIGVFALQNITSILVAALVGFHRSDQKSMAMLAGLAIQAVLAVMLIGRYGLQGVAAGQVAQWTVLLGVGWTLVVRLAGGSPVPTKFRKGAFRDLVGFGVRMQMLNVANFLYDPVVKFIFAAVGGVAAVGIYDLMLRGLLQARQFILAPTQNLTPLLAAAHHDGDTALRRTYEQPLAVLILVATPAMATLAFGSPVLSTIWLGYIDPDFVIYSLIAAAGWLVNMVSVPAWHLGVATGRLRWNIAGAFATSAGALVTSYILGLAMGGVGVVIGAVGSIAAGGVLTWVMNTRHLGLPLLPERSAWSSVRTKAIAAIRKFMPGRRLG